MPVSRVGLPEGSLQTPEGETGSSATLAEAERVENACKQGLATPLQNMIQGP